MYAPPGAHTRAVLGTETPDVSIGHYDVMWPLDGGQRRVNRMFLVLDDRPLRLRLGLDGTAREFSRRYRHISTLALQVNRTPHAPDWAELCEGWREAEIETVQLFLDRTDVAGYDTAGFVHCVSRARVFALYTTGMFVGMFGRPWQGVPALTNLLTQLAAVPRSWRRLRLTGEAAVRTAIDLGNGAPTAPELALSVTEFDSPLTATTWAWVDGLSPATVASVRVENLSVSDLETSLPRLPTHARRGTLSLHLEHPLAIRRASLLAAPLEDTIARFATVRIDTVVIHYARVGPDVPPDATITHGLLQLSVLCAAMVAAARIGGAGAEAWQIRVHVTHKVPIAARESLRHITDAIAPDPWPLTLLVPAATVAEYTEANRTAGKHTFTIQRALTDG